MELSSHDLMCDELKKSQIFRATKSVIYGTRRGLFGNRTFPDKRKISPESEKNGDYSEIHISGVN